ncbi:hypothetical protein Pelo_4543 [Pelomyxa schiedti]|nr:hypothetical protein Pelo_4543 [Pelomyxa schiedti]
MAHPRCGARSVARVGGLFARRDDILNAARLVWEVVRCGPVRRFSVCVSGVVFTFGVSTLTGGVVAGHAPIQSSGTTRRVPGGRLEQYDVFAANDTHFFETRSALMSMTEYLYCRKIESSIKESGGDNGKKLFELNFGSPRDLNHKWSVECFLVGIKILNLAALSSLPEQQPEGGRAIPYKNPNNQHKPSIFMNWQSFFDEAVLAFKSPAGDGIELEVVDIARSWSTLSFISVSSTKFQKVTVIDSLLVLHTAESNRRAFILLADGLRKSRQCYTVYQFLEAAGASDHPQEPLTCIEDT